jgi:DNA-binding transcriptional LysR family regulator
MVRLTRAGRRLLRAGRRLLRAGRRLRLSVRGTLSPNGRPVLHATGHPITVC